MLTEISLASLKHHFFRLLSDHNSKTVKDMLKPSRYLKSAQKIDSEKRKKIRDTMTFFFYHFCPKGCQSGKKSKKKAKFFLVFFAGITFQAESIDTLFDKKNQFQSQK